MLLYNPNALLNTLAIENAHDKILVHMVVSYLPSKGKTSYITISYTNDTDGKCIQYAVYEDVQSGIEHAYEIVEILKDYYTVNFELSDISDLYQ